MVRDEHTDTQTHGQKGRANRVGYIHFLAYIHEFSKEGHPAWGGSPKLCINPASFGTNFSIGMKTSRIHTQLLLNVQYGDSPLPARTLFLFILYQQINTIQN